MNSRRFTDETGVEWRVRATMPNARAGAALPEAFSRGWLVFESSSGAIRRLAPIPEGWETAPPAQLERYFGDAIPARERSEGMTGEMRRYEPGLRAGPTRDAGA